MTSRHGILALIERAEGGPFFTYRQVGEAVGRSHDTIRYWVEQGNIDPPTHRMPLGDNGEKAWVWLFTQDDLEVIEAYSYIVHPGRPKNRKAS